MSEISKVLGIEKEVKKVMTIYLMREITKEEMMKKVDEECEKMKKRVEKMMGDGYENEEGEKIKCYQFAEKELKYLDKMGSVMQDDLEKDSKFSNLIKIEELVIMDEKKKFEYYKNEHTKICNIIVNKGLKEALVCAEYHEEMMKQLKNEYSLKEEINVEWENVPMLDHISKWVASLVQNQHQNQNFNIPMINSKYSISSPKRKKQPCEYSSIRTISMYDN